MYGRGFDRILELALARALTFHHVTIDKGPVNGLAR